MTDKNEPIKTAFYILSSEVRRKKLSDIDLTLIDPEWLKIDLLREERTLWLGYKNTLGYFLSWEKGEPSDRYFELNNETISGILALSPNNSTQVNVDQDLSSQARELFASINEPEPDSEKIKRIIEDTPSTEEGIDVLATVASIKAFRNSIEKLRWLIETQENSSHSEKEYQNILSSNPWILGSHYKEVLVKEYSMWFGAEVDLMLVNALGYVDIVELRLPDTEILKKSKRVGTWHASTELSDAQGQARKYVQILDEHRNTIEANLPLAKQSVSRVYRSSVVIIAGRTPDDKDALEALRDINMSDKRILILTYDDILAIAEATIEIFERKLLRSNPLLG